MSEENSKTYRVERLTETMVIDANWDKRQWRNIEPVNIALHMGDKPEHRPKTQAKILYDEQNIYVIFRVEDMYVRAVETKMQGLICLDSCVEFFFTPGEDINAGYFNLETNCIGTMLCRHQVNRNQVKKLLTLKDFEQIEVATSLGTEAIDPEIQELTTWTLEYRLPLEVLNNIYPITVPAAGVKWRANFYKCADKTSHPHWLTWSKVALERPDFHRPEFFGTLEFVD